MRILADMLKDWRQHRESTFRDKKKAFQATAGFPTGIRARMQVRIHLKGFKTASAVPPFQTE